VSTEDHGIDVTLGGDAKSFSSKTNRLSSE